ERQHAGSLARTPPDLGHDGVRRRLHFGRGFQGFQRGGHDDIPSMPTRITRVEPSLPRLHTPCKEPAYGYSRTEDRKMKLKGQGAIVTGAGRNIGEEVAKLFAAEGAKIAVVVLDKARGQRTVDAAKAAGGDAEAFVTDVSKSADVAALVKGVV